MIEKILERLEECQDRYEDVAHYEMLENGRTLDYEYSNGKKDGILEAIEIVQEVAKDGGWIPCSERLPEIYEDSKTSDTVLVCTVDGFQHMAFFCSDNKWRYCESGMIGESMEWTEIVAWQPLPAPYQKEKQ